MSSTNYDNLRKRASPRGKPRGKPGTNMITKDNLHVGKDQMSRIVGESTRYFRNKPPKDNAELADRINAYFDQCMETGQLPTVEDLGLALGVTRKALWKWERGVNTDPERAMLVQRAKEVLAAIDAKLVSEGKIPQVAYIFRAKNYFGMKDQQDMVITPDLTEDRLNDEKYWKKYLGPAFDKEQIEKQNE